VPNTSIYIMSKDDWLETWELHVSKTAKIMRKHIKEFSLSSWGIIETDLDDVLGMVHPVISPNECFAYCFLSEEDLGAGVVAHECGHVAFAHERLIRFGMCYGNECNNNEERLLHYMTECLKGTYNILYDHGHIKRTLRGTL